MSEARAELRSEGVPFMPHLHALRAFGLVLVLLHHLGKLPGWPDWFPAGACGVDVFFVVSGYVITRNWWEKLATADRSPRTLGGLMFRFWKRRVCRLLPSSLTAIVIVLIGTALFLSRSDLYHAAVSAFWCVLLQGNDYFAGQQTGYFDRETLRMPLLHFWSLVVEEQFYIFYPLILCGCVWITRSKWLLAGVLGVLAIASFAYNVASFPHAQSAAYYHLFGRAWAMLTGCLIGLLPMPKVAPRLAAVTGLSGLAGTLLFAMIYVDTANYPHYAALLPVLATGAVIAVGFQSEWLTRMLSFRPGVELGEVSYAWYVWHWPLICFANALFPNGGPEIGALVIIACLALSDLSYAAVEVRLRFSKRWREILAASFGVLLAAWLVSDFHLADIATRRAEDFDYVLVTPSRIRKDDVPTFGAPDGPLEIVLWGDCRVMALRPAFDRMLKQRGTRGAIISWPATAPVLNAADSRISGREWAEAAIAYCERHQAPKVILAGVWDASANRKVPETVAAITAGGSECIVLHDVPVFEKDVWEAYYEGSDHTALTIDREQADKKYPQPDPAAIRMAGGRVVDLRSLFLSDDKGRYVAIRDGRLRYIDHCHIAQSTIQREVVPVLKASLE